MQNILRFDPKPEGHYFSVYQVNTISEYSGTIKSTFAQNKSSRVQLSVSRIIRNGGNGMRPVTRDGTSGDSCRRRNCIGGQTEKYQGQERKTICSYVRIYTCCSRYLLAMGIGLDWIAASAVQTLKTSMWVGLSRSCFKLKLHFPVHHVRPATIYSCDSPLGCIFCLY